MSYRSWVSVAAWAVLVIIAAKLALDSGSSLRIALSLLVLGYGVQGLIGAYLGVSVDEEGVSFPNPALSGVPFLTLGRRRLPRGSFDRVDRYGDRSVIIFYAGDPIFVPLPSSEHKKMFLTEISRAFPDVKVSR